MQMCAQYSSLYVPFHKREKPLNLKFSSGLLKVTAEGPQHYGIRLCPESILTLRRGVESHLSARNRTRLLGCWASGFSLPPTRWAPDKHAFISYNHKNIFRFDIFCWRLGQSLHYRKMTAFLAIKVIATCFNNIILFAHEAHLRLWNSACCTVSVPTLRFSVKMYDN